jgi:RNA polymerase sigma factor (sigma-70 family)
MMDINRLLHRAAGGDEDARNKLFQYLFVRFKIIAKRRIGTRDAEDIAQETCLTVLQKYQQETFTKSFEQWAYGVLKMKIGNYLQGELTKQKKTGPYDDRQPSFHPDKLSPNYDLPIRLLRCLRQIILRNPLYARVLNFVYQGYSTEEICRRLDINSNYLYVALNRARKMMRSCLEKNKV